MLTLGSGGGTLTGRLHPGDNIEGELPALLVRSLANYWIVPFCVRLAPDGSFTTRLPAGRYLLDVHSPERRWFTDFTAHQLEAGATATVDQRLFFRSTLVRGPGE